MPVQPLQRISVSENPYNAETPLSTLLDDITPSDLVYVRNHFDIPKIDTNDWSLTVDNMGKNPISISYDELRKLPAKTLTVTLECAGNGRKSMRPIPEGTAWDYGAISIVEFTGTSLSNLLNKAGISDDVVEVIFHGADKGEVGPNRVEKYSSLPLDVALDPDILLAWEMNGHTLTPNHGFPLRVVVPNWYGMASVKWLKQIELSTKPFNGFFQSEHYVYVDEDGLEPNAPVRHIRPRALILHPGNEENLDQKEIELNGIAWSGHGEIVQVDISTDGGATWSEAKVESTKSKYGIQQWRSKWIPSKVGKYKLLVRAKDSTGYAQPQSQVWNRLGYGNNGPHTIFVSVI